MRIPVYIVFVFLGLATIPGLVSVEKATFSEEADRPLAIVRYFKPTVNVQNLSVDKRIEVDSPGEKLYSGDTLTTNKGGYAYVLFMDKSVAKVKPESRLIVTGKTENTTKSTSARINLEEGNVLFDIVPQGAGSFEVATSRSLASVKGTVFGADADGYVWVSEGQVDVTALVSGETISLFEQMYARVNENADQIESGVLEKSDVENLVVGFDDIEQELQKRTIILRFRDANGQIREVPIEYFEKDGN
ncbi:MAG: FecR family protein [Bacteroidota bacterium]